MIIDVQKVLEVLTLYLFLKIGCIDADHDSVDINDQL